MMMRRRRGRRLRRRRDEDKGMMMRSPRRGFNLALQPHDVSQDMAKAMLQHAVLLENIYGKMQKIILLAEPDTDQSDKLDCNRMFEQEQVALLSSADADEREGAVIGGGLRSSRLGRATRPMTV